MNDKRPHNPIDAAAADWVARLDRDGEASAGREAFEQWLAEDTRHYGAYVRAQAMWTRLDRGAVLDAGALSRPVQRAGVSRRGWLIGTGVAAAAGVGGFAFLNGRVRRFSYDAALGEISQVSLPDGSTATLDTDSRITVALSKATRTVHIERGRVWFKVAKNHDWPFVVESGPTRVRAVGTAFAVERTGGGTEVVVTEGVVDAWAASSPTSQVLRLERGGRARLTADRAERLAALPAADLDRTLAWRDGMISLYGETLGEASAAFNRYNRRKIVVDDPKLAARRVVGHFRLQDPKSFANAAADLLGAQVHDSGEHILLAADGRPPAR